MNRRPRITIRLSRFQAAIALLMFASGGIAYRWLPERIPFHWGIRGEINGWAERSLPNVFFAPLIVLGIVLLAYLLPRIDPLRRSYERFTASYYLILDAIVGLLALFYGLTLYAAFNTSVPVGVLVPFTIGLLIAVIGNQMPKIRRNFFIGIRTPWTLASETVWHRTHRIGTRLFLFAGLGAALAAFLPPPLNFIVFISLILGAALAAMVLSYLIYRRLDAAGKLTDKIEEPTPDP